MFDTTNGFRSSWMSMIRAAPTLALGSYPPSAANSDGYWGFYVVKLSPGAFSGARPHPAPTG
jgi:hypothetical protein